MKDAQIQNIPLFADLNSKERRALGKEFKLEQYRRGETIFAKNSHGDALYLIEEGRISLSTDGKTTLATLGPGSLLGEAEFFQGTPHAMTARAATDVAVSVLDSDSLATLIGNDPYLGIRLSQTLGAPLAHMTGYLAGQLAAIPVMKPLSNNERTLIAEKLVAREYEANQAIYRSSDAATGLYLIQEGVVRLIGESDDDYTELGDGDIFGEMALLSGKPHADTAQTAQTSVIWHLSPSDFVEIAQAQPGIRANLSRTITARLSQADRAYAAEILKQIPLFSQLGPEALADATGYLMLRHVPAGQTIFKAGDHGDAMFIIESGQVELRDDQNRVAARLAEGNYLGELTLMTGKTRIKTAVTTADTNLWGMYRPDFDALLVKHPQLSAALGHALRDRLSAADNQFIEKHLQKLALLGGLSRLQLDEISARLHARRYQTGDTLYQEGQPGQELYFIENGQVERFTSTTSGIVALPSLTSGDFLGETALLSGRPHATTARAQTDLDIWVLEKPDFDELVYKYPNLSAILNRIMSDRVVETMEFIRNAQPRQGAAVTPGRPAAGQRPVSGRVPPVPVRLIAPPPPPFSGGSRPISPPIPGSQLPRRAGGPVKTERRTQGMKVTSGAARPKARPAAKPKSKRVAKSQARRRASQPVPRQRNAKRPTPAANVTRGAGKVGAGLQRRIDGLSEWYAGIAVGTRIGLFALILLLVYLCGIVAPASIINALAATILEDNPALVQNGGSSAEILVGELSQGGMVAALPFVETTTPTPTATPSPTNTPTPSATVTQTPIPTFTPSPTNTPTPVDTPTLTPTPTATDTPTATPIPATATPVPLREPTNTPTPSATPTPDVDFLVTKVRKLTPCENQGKHHIFIHVIDATGQGLNDVPVKISWGTNATDNVITKTEAKDKGPGYIEFAMFKGTYSVAIAGAKTQVASGITPDFQVDEPCLETGNQVGNSLFHASFEVIFQRTY